MFLVMRGYGIKAATWFGSMLCQTTRISEFSGGKWEGLPFVFVTLHICTKARSRFYIMRWEWDREGFIVGIFNHHSQNVVFVCQCTVAEISHEFWAFVFVEDWNFVYVLVEDLLKAQSSLSVFKIFLSPLSLSKNNSLHVKPHKVLRTVCLFMLKCSSNHELIT